MTRPGAANGDPPRRSRAARIALALGGAAVFLALMALGTWQVQRLGWKTDLVARVEARLAAAPVAAPGPATWSAVEARDDEYRRVRLAGTLLHDRETLTQALTELGAGFWVMTPLRAADGAVTLVNRGFVPADRRDPASRPAGNPAGPVTVEGLLRLPEPGGGFLRRNDPAVDRWYSRDVAAIAARHDLGPVAPFFVDADAAPNPGGWPRGGLTVVRFRNHHLVYALTWYALAAMLAAAGAWSLRQRRRPERGGSGEGAAAAQGAAR